MKKLFIGNAIAFLLVVGVGLRLYHSYRSNEDIHPESHAKIQKMLEQNLGTAIVQEFAIRLGEEELQKEEWFIPPDNEDTARYVTMKITTQDTAFSIQLKRNDIMAKLRAKQFIFKGFNPVNLQELNSLIIQSFQRNDVKLERSYMEYLDLTNLKVIAHSESAKPIKCPNCLESYIHSLDILDTVGVKAYVEVASPSVWKYLKLEIYIFCLAVFLLLISVIVTVTFKGR